MVSKKLLAIILISIPIFVIHGTEEYVNHFYDTYPLLSLNWAPQFFQTIPQATFLSFQVMWWLLLVIAFLALSGKRGTKIVLILLGFVYIYELTHPLSAILEREYTPGLFTSLLFPLITFFYWKELVINLKK